MTLTADLLSRLRAARGEGIPTPSAAQAEAPLRGTAPAAPSDVLPVPVKSPTPRPAPPSGPGVKAPPPRPRPGQRPSMTARAEMSGHCGTCRAFTPTPSEGRWDGECSHGRGAFEPWARHSRVSVTMHAAARCMTLPFPRWALRAGVHAAPDIDRPPGGEA